MYKNFQIDPVYENSTLASKDKIKSWVAGGNYKKKDDEKEANGDHIQLISKIYAGPVPKKIQI